MSLSGHFARSASPAVAIVLLRVRPRRDKTALAKFFEKLAAQGEAVSVV